MDNHTSTFARRGLSISAAAAALLLAVVSGRADTIEDPGGVFSNVTIVALDDEKIVVLFDDGRTLQRRADELKRVEIAPGNDVAADELTRAESLRLQDKRREAITLYERVVTLSEKAWVQDYALMRLVGLYARTGDLMRSYDAYARLARSHPQLCELVCPRQFPRADSAPCRQILHDIEERLRRPQPESVVTALKFLRETIMNPPRAAAEVAATQPVPGGALSPVRPAARVDPAVRAPQLVGEARAAIAARDQPAVDRVLAELARLSGKAETDDTLIVRAEAALAADEPRQGGLLAMRIIAEYPRSAHVPDALFASARSQEMLGRGLKAAELYDRCASHPRCGPDLKKRAAECAAALQPAAASVDPPSDAVP